MRSDYGLYVVALICFIIAGAFLASAIPEYPFEEISGQVATAIFVILGIMSAAGGYALRPKVTVPVPTAPPPLTAEPSLPPSPPTVEEKVEEVPPAPPPPTEEHVPSVSAIPPPVEEEAPTPAPSLEEEKPAEKPVRRRRRKKTAKQAPP